MLMGENGNTATGDSIFMRGFDTQSSIYVDGIRDLGTISRDTFNTEQVEIAKGPAGVDNGRGSSSGYINMSSKAAQADSFINANATVGSGSHKRVSADINQQLPIDGAAVRVNLLRQDSGVAGRDVVENNTTGLATSLVFGLDSATRTTFNYLHVQQDNVPDGGIPTIGLDGFYSATIASNFPNNTAPSYGEVDSSTSMAAHPTLTTLSRIWRRCVSNMTFRRTSLCKTPAATASPAKNIFLRVSTPAAQGSSFRPPPKRISAAGKSTATAKAKINKTKF
jgi:outer membrane receptor for monomeric catechols